VHLPFLSSISDNGLMDSLIPATSLFVVARMAPLLKNDVVMETHRRRIDVINLSLLGSRVILAARSVKECM
jgi:hypothetical protein